MARSSAQITPDLVEAFRLAGIRVVQTANGHWLAKNYDRPTGSNLQRIREMSMMRYCGRRWRMLSDSDKIAWKNFAAPYGFNGFNAFVKGICASYIKDGFGLGVGKFGTALLAGGASNFWSTVNTNYLSKVSRVTIGQASQTITIRQKHPREYIMRERASKKNHVFLFNNKTEEPVGNLTFGCGYNIIPSDEGISYTITLKVRLYTSESDTVGTEIASLPLTFTPGWNSATYTAPLGSGEIWGYSLDFVLSNFTGDFFFDNINATYLGTNFAFDGSCEIVVWNRANNWPEVVDIWSIVGVVNSTILEMNRYDKNLLTNVTSS
jgi:hypothetical protein